MRDGKRNSTKEQIRRAGIITGFRENLSMKTKEKTVMNMHFHRDMFLWCLFNLTLLPINFLET